MTPIQPARYVSKNWLVPRSGDSFEEKSIGQSFSVPWKFRRIPIQVVVRRTRYGGWVTGKDESLRDLRDWGEKIGDSESADWRIRRCSTGRAEVRVEKLSLKMVLQAHRPVLQASGSFFKLLPCSRP